MTDSPATPGSPKRRRGWLRLPRFGIRGLLIFTTFCCLMLAAWSVYVDPFRQQATAVARIRQLDGEVEERAATGPGWQQWLVKKFLGEDAFTEAYRVVLKNVKVPEEMQTQLGRLPYVQHLELDGAEIDDRLVRSLLPGEQLEHLSLRYTNITNNSLAAAARFPQLRTLKVTGAEVGDDGFLLLADNGSLQELFIRWTNVTEEGVAEFKQRCPECDVHYHVQ